MTKKDKKARAAARCAARYSASVEVSSKEAFLEETSKNATKIRHELAIILVALARVLIKHDCFYGCRFDCKEAVDTSIKEALQEVCGAFTGDSSAWYYGGWRAMRSFAVVKMSLEDVYGPLGTKVYGDGVHRDHISTRLTEQIFSFIVEYQELSDSELVEAIAPAIELD